MEDILGEEARVGGSGSEQEIYTRGDRELYTLRRVLARAPKSRGLYSLGRELERRAKGGRRYCEFARVLRSLI
jgi:hypothetical protein